MHKTHLGVLSPLSIVKIKVQIAELSLILLSWKFVQFVAKTQNLHQ